MALWVSRLGSTPVVIVAGLAGVLLSARRCRTVAVVMLITIAARPPFEWLVKEVVGRPRPSGARLVPGTGFAYPSGHVLAAAATWGFVPVIAALYVQRRWVRWALTTLAWVVIGLVAWCRVWLGVHWTSDVVGALAIAFVALSTAEAAIDRWHQPHPPRDDPPDAPGTRSSHHGLTAQDAGGIRAPPHAHAVVASGRSRCNRRRGAVTPNEEGLRKLGDTLGQPSHVRARSPDALNRLSNGRSAMSSTAFWAPNVACTASRLPTTR